MINDELVHLAMRSRLLTLEAVTTGSVTLGATASGYTRSAGSFLADGFAIGMEVTATGFSLTSNNGASVVTQVAAGTLMVKKTPAPVTEGAGAGRTLVCGLPVGRAWENKDFRPVAGQPYVDEDYVPGPRALITVGSPSWAEGLPLYIVRLYVAQGVSILALRRYAAGVLTLFPPKQALTLSSGDIVRVRGDTAPFPGQLMPIEEGWSMVSITIPLRVRSQNPL